MTMEEQNNRTDYTEDNIKSLDWSEHIRLRPGMYIGKLGDGASADDGVYVLIKEVIDNSIDEFTILDTIIAKPGLSQADLARLILKGKAHTGRFIMALEEKGLLERHVAERDGKVVAIRVEYITEDDEEDM